MTLVFVFRYPWYVLNPSRSSDQFRKATKPNIHLEYVLLTIALDFWMQTQS